MCHELDGPSARYGRLGFVAGGDGWHLFDEGLTGGMFRDGVLVRHVLLEGDGPFHVNVGAADGHLVEIDVVPAEPTPVFPEWVTVTHKPDLTVVPDVTEVPTDETDNAEPPIQTRTSPKPPAPLLVARRLGVQAATGRQLISGIDVALKEHSLTAVIGPSGAGKSTLLHTLAGQIGPSDGGVWWRGHHIHEEYTDLRTQIGFVPQEEIQHPQLSVRQSLLFSARLRLPANAGRGLIEDRVDDVIAQVGLQREQRQRIGSQLSGGQKKRVSIATELLTAPPLLFLDEPTSGLDPGRDRSVMHQLRELADDGRVIVVATHSVLGLDLCDTVIVLARGGRLAYAGSPDRLLDHFDCDDYPQMFDLLEFQRNLPSLPSAPPALQPSKRAPIATPPSSAARQFATLVIRNVALLFSDRLHLSMLVLMPLVLAGLSRIVQGENGLLMPVDSHGIFRAMEANQRLTILVIAATLMGTAMSIRDLVQERAVFRREYAVGLSPGAYYASKALVFGIACFLQGVIVARLATWGLPEQHRGGVHEWGWWEIAIPLGLLATVMSLVGLWISASVRSTEQTTPSLVAVVMSQIALCGALIPVAGRALIEQITMFAPGRWAYAATASSAHLDRSPRFMDDNLIAFTPQQYLYDVLGLLILGIVVCWAGAAAVRKVK
jgi:ABC-type multidrug transport system ATPase subunit